jgi:epoxide hydrolase-like predicted phosphatase
MAILVLDIGGVVYRSWPDDAFHERWAARCGCDAAALSAGLWGGSEWREAEVGLITGKACFAAAAGRLGVGTDLVRAMVMAAFVSQPDEALADYVSGLRGRGVRVAALTNNTSGETELIRRPAMSRLFDLIVSSADVGVAKPDAAIYRHAERRLDAQGDELVFVDDVEANVEAAKALGWRGVWFRSTEQAIGEIAAAIG